MKIKYLIFSFIMVVIFSLNVYALPSLSITGNTSIDNNGTVDLNVVLNNDGQNISAINFNLDYGSSIMVKNNTTNQSWISTIDSAKGVSIKAAENDYLANGTVMVLSVKNISLTNQSASLLLKDIKFNNNISGDNVTYALTLQGVTTTVKLSSSALLSKLSYNVGTISPTFDPNITSYKINIDRDTIQAITLRGTCKEAGCTYSVTCETDGCTVSGNSKVTLVIGKNIVHYTVLSEDKTATKDYVLTIYRGPSTDNSSYLKSLGIEGFTLNEKFDKNNLDYTASVDYEHEKINILAEAEDPNATVQIKGNEKLVVGKNTITITLTSSETGDKRIYNIIVTREDFKANVSSTTTKAIVEIKKTSNKVGLIIIIALIGSAIIGVSAYFIFHKRKPNDKNKKDLITDEGKIKNENEKQKNIEVKENELADDLNMTEKPFKPSVDDALADLMETREIELNKNEDHLI
jgi:hypothetical protein